MSVLGSPSAPVSPFFEYSEEENQTRTEFKDKVQAVRNEIQTKFINLNEKLKEEETHLLNDLNKIENETLASFESTSRALVEIQQAKEQIVATLKNSLTNTLLNNTIEMYDREIESIKKESRIDTSTIQLNWNVIQFENICALKLVTEPQIILIPTPPNPLFLEDLPPSHASSIPIPPMAPAPFIPSQSFPHPTAFQSVEFQRPSFFQCLMPRQTELSLESGYISTVAPYPKSFCREQAPYIGQQPEKKGKYESDNHWQCQHCCHYNVMKYSFCENCHKSRD